MDSSSDGPARSPRVARDPSTASVQHRRKPYDYSKPRPNYARSKRGCLSCRSRKKKCDEARPRCSGCCRNGLTCRWADAPSETEDDSVHGTFESFHITSPEASETLSKPNSALVRIENESLPRALPVSRPGSACTLTPVSLSLLQHYLEHTACLLASVRSNKTPFITLVMPLAYADDLLMHTVLALSGSHLAVKQECKATTSTAITSGSIWNATAQHYHKTISGLRQELANFDTTDAHNQVRILLILIIVCHYEAVCGNTDGVMIQHLRAGRELIRRLLSRPLAKDVNMESLGFSLELHAYLSIVNSLSLYGPNGDLSTPYDAFLTSLDALSSYSTFGTMFAGCHSLFQLIPQISQLGIECVAEEMLAEDSWSPSERLQASYRSLRDLISDWTFTSPADGYSLKEQEQTLVAAEAYRHGLYIYLFTAFAGSRRPNTQILLSIQTHINKFLLLVSSIMTSQIMTIILWPTVIISSCMVDEVQRSGLIYSLQNSPYEMNHLFRIAEVLKLLWEDDDPQAYGPYGLYMTMDKHRMYIPMI
ncbi:Transcriptional activator UGA3-like protein [Cladobotryum mycophilum]|uniref:Transcriptional activator UGA3-like protein n=1 Tax=Cladobotryum mycophilum TaxID=491253 RepID=A0ABR0SB40_9HYPO